MTNKKETALVPFQKQYPVLYSDMQEIKKSIEENLGGETFSQFDLPRVPMPQGKNGSFAFTDLAGNEVSEKELNGIIIAFKSTRQYYLSPDPSNEPPDCWSEDAITGAGIRSKDQKEPSAMACLQCPLSAWNTSEKGKGQACSSRKVLFILLPGAQLPYVLSLSPGSLKNFKTFQTRLVMNSLYYYGVQTTLTCEKAESGGIVYQKVVFNAEKLDNESLLKAYEYHKLFAPTLVNTSVKPETSEE